MTLLQAISGLELDKTSNPNSEDESDFGGKNRRRVVKETDSVSPAPKAHPTGGFKPALSKHKHLLRNLMLFNGNSNMSLIQVDGITIGSLDDVPAGPVSSFFKSIRSTLDFDFDDENEG